MGIFIMPKVFMDSIHGTIKLGEHLLDFINTPEFQRLINIKQLGNCHYLFPCATHTRYEHSIGVAYLIDVLLKHLKTEQPELNINDRDIQLVQIAGLCHDIGHGCFSHLFDHSFLSDKIGLWKNHEYRSKIIIRYMVEKYSLNYTKEEIDFICMLIDKPTHFCGKPKFYFEIVSNYKSGLDCDKMDYLLRDGKNIGINLSVDYLSLFSSARVIDDTIAYLDTEAINIFNIFHSRYYMHKKIYNHPTIHAIDLMTIDILKDMDARYKLEENITNIEQFIKYIDNIIELDAFNNTENTTSIVLLNRIKRRHLYKCIFNATFKDFEKIQILKRLLEKELDMFKDRLIYVSCKLNYNLKDKNPIDEISFYNEKDIHVAYKLKNETLIMPSYFEEFTFMVYIKDDTFIAEINNKLKEIKTLLE